MLQKLTEKEQDLQKLKRYSAGEVDAAAPLQHMSSSIKEELKTLIRQRKDYLTHCEAYHERLADISRSLDVATASLDASRLAKETSLQQRLAVLQVR
jgi:hypothetical protein